MKLTNLATRNPAIYFNSGLLILFFQFLLAGSVFADELDDWKLVKSANMELYTDYDDDIAIETLEKFEIFRAVTINLLKSDTKQNLLPVKIFLFRTENMWKNLQYAAGNGGYFYNSVYGPQMFVKPFDHEVNLEVLYHEYVHYLLNTNSPIAIAPWYNEGIADFFATMLIEDDFVYIGKLHSDRAEALSRVGLLKLKDVLGTRSLFDKNSRFKRTFYPSAWLTTHYFTLGARNGFPSRYANSMKLLELQSQGADFDDAYAESFDISMRDLQREIKKYARTGSKEGVALPIPEVDVSSIITRLSSTQIKSALAPAFGWSDKNSLGRQYLTEAAASGDSFALSVQALHFAKQSNDDASLAIINKLKTRADLNHAVHHNIALSFMSMEERAENANDSERALSLNNKVKQHLESSLQVAEYLPSYVALANHAAIYESKEAALDVVAAMLNYAPNQYWSRLAAAKVYLAVDEVELAKENITSALRLTGHNEESQKTLKDLLKNH
ncbi:hypothetical protein [Glaciecola sp. MF2-115]|uniref:hypothetical protein n=1 Tax=Glaciecola sp. MF2-115 TaxID=3384827 RepID=UPI0039A1F270